MAAFKQDFTIQQSNDCVTLTLIDNSNFGDNTEGYDYSSFDIKNITIYDNLNNVLVILPIVDTTPVTYTVTKDMYYEIVYTLQHSSDTPLVLVKTLALSCFVELVYGSLVANNCDCSNDTSIKLFQVSKGIKAAQIFASRGNGVLSQDMLDYSNGYASDCTNGLDKDGGNCGCGCK